MFTAVLMGQGNDGSSKVGPAGGEPLVQRNEPDEPPDEPLAAAPALGAAVAGAVVAGAGEIPAQDLEGGPAADLVPAAAAGSALVLVDRQQHRPAGGRCQHGPAVGRQADTGIASHRSVAGNIDVGPAAARGIGQPAEAAGQQLPGRA